MKDTMTHEEIRSLFSELYNQFYLQHRMPPEELRTDEQWDALTSASERLYKKYDSLLARNMISALINEFSREEEAIKKRNKG